MNHCCQKKILIKLVQRLKVLTGDMISVLGGDGDLLNTLPQLPPEDGEVPGD